MLLEKSFIPYGAYWSTPYARWQGALSALHSIRLAAAVSTDELARREIDANTIGAGILGATVIQQHCFFGLPWLGGLIGADELAGPTINQACATSARCIISAAETVSCDGTDSVLIVTADRTSNGPHIYHPEPNGPGGTGQHEDWVLDNFNYDPHGRTDMLQTAENVAAKWEISTAEQHDVVLRRYEQYEAALADDCAFQRRFMTLPFEVPDPRFRKTVTTLTTDEGVIPAIPENLARLKPVREGGTVTYAGQTHPADGNTALIVTNEDKLADYTRQPEIKIRVIGYGQGRAEKSFMPVAPVLSTRRALESSNLDLSDVDAIKSHNPFAVNDIVFARETGADLNAMNNNGCSLIYGHPQGPTGLRACIELIEELVERGGGIGLFNGCAAGDSAISLLFRVGD